MRFNIISNLTNGVGLQRDFELLRTALEARGHQVSGVQFNAKPLVISPANVNIFDELVVPEAFRAAPQQWVMPHPEWWYTPWDQHQDHFTKVLAKTRDCERIFRKKVGDRCQYLGWVAKDLYRPGVTKTRHFLHVSGKSSFKNTHTVIQGCRSAGVGVTVIGQHTPTPRRVTEDALIHAMNTHFCHVMPSAYEGYGHILHESQSVGQILITTDAPPMNELKPAFYVPSVSQRLHGVAPLHRVSPQGVREAIKKVCDLTSAEIQVLAGEARAQFEADQRAFQQALDALVGR